MIDNPLPPKPRQVPKPVVLIEHVQAASFSVDGVRYQYRALDAYRVDGDPYQIPTNQ